MNHVDPSKSSSTSPPRKVQRAFTGLAGRDIEPARNTAKPAVNGNVIDEDKLRQQLGIVKTEKRITLPDSYRTLLNLDPQDIVDFFDVIVDHKNVFEQVDFAVPSSMLEHRIERLKKLIAASKAIVEGMASNIIKIRRGKNDPLLADKAAREMYKRHENARIARCNMRLHRYRTALRAGNYHEKVWSVVVEKPVYFRDVVQDGVDVIAVLDTGYIDKKGRMELVEFVRRDYFNLERYRTIMKLDTDSLFELGDTDSEQSQTWRDIQHWENVIIVAAVHHGVIALRRDLADLLGLGGVLDADDPDLVGTREMENKLALKTGGAVYGGRIKGEGYRNGKRRKLTSFDKPLHILDGSTGGDGYNDPGFQSMGDYSDDAESYYAPDPPA